MWTEVELAAHQVALQVIHFAFLPTAAFAEAGSVMAGQAVGAGRTRSVRRVAHIALSGALVYMLLCTLILVSRLGCSPRRSRGGSGRSWAWARAEAGSA